MAYKNLPIVDWLQINSSAPGKFIISGEYSVIYEKQAIATAIDLRTNVTIRPGKDAKVRLNLKDFNTVREWPTSSLTTYRLISKYSECLHYTSVLPDKLNNLLNARYIVNREDALSSSASGEEASAHNPPTEVKNNDQIKTGESSLRVQSDDRDWVKQADNAVIAFLLLYLGLGDSYSSSARPAIEVDVESSIPVGSGLGSSSAYSVSLCGALLRVFRVAAERYIISNWALNIDKLFHGRPSGVDNNIVTMGGFILFQNGKIKASGIARKAPFRAMLIDTGVQRSTKSVVKRFSTKLQSDQAKYNGHLNSIDDITGQIWQKLREPNFTPRLIADYLEANQGYLEDLGVGHERLTDIREKARQFGLTVKLTGAGGGGTAFLLYDDTDNLKDIEQFRELLIASGYHVHDHDVGCEGLTVKIVSDPNKKFQIGDR